MKFRDARENDLPAIIQLLADDPIGADREDYRLPLPRAYSAAFEDISIQHGNRIILAVDDEETISGCLQLTIIPGLTRQGMKRALVEGVRVHSDHRGQCIGTKLFEYAIEQAKQWGCGLVQLTTDKQRSDALRFYQKLGFQNSHAGMKLML